MRVVPNIVTLLVATILIPAAGGTVRLERPAARWLVLLVALMLASGASKMPLPTRVEPIPASGG